MKERIIRAVYDEHTITVYQAYRTEIAQPAIQQQTFVPPFKMERMTWIKPSFLWMMYRSGWAEKAGQEHVLAIKIKREGWEWAIQHACLSHFIPSIHHSEAMWQKTLHQSPVRVQWDPEKDILLKNLPYRAIQVGLTGVAVEKYVNEWIVSITDISPQCREIHHLLTTGQTARAQALLPREQVYPLPDQLKQHLLYSA